jgi:hypothetical protein
VTTVDEKLREMERAPDASHVIEWEDAHPWPTLAPQALHGAAGEFVRMVSPQSEADPAGLLVAFLCAFGAAVGPSAYFEVESTRHYARTSAILVGATASARKGTTNDHVLRVLRIADEEWLARGIVRGLASGEGLIQHFAGGDRDVLPEKRAVILDPEFARTLAAAAREGSILSHIIREVFDSGLLSNLTRKNPLFVDGVHAAILGNVTAEELRAKLDRTEIANGFVNRLLLVLVKRSKLLPNGGSLCDADFAPIAKRVRDALDFGRNAKQMHRSPAADSLWAEWYYAQPEPEGLLGALTARAQAQVLRLSMLFALFGCSSMIEDSHLHAAIAVWDYAAASARHIFGDVLGDDVADRILEELRDRYREPVSRNEIRALFAGHRSSARITAALRYLQSRGLASVEKIETQGRYSEAWRALPPRAKSAGSPLTALNAQGETLARDHAQPGDDEAEVL